jgi:hypothetical protein
MASLPLAYVPGIHVLTSLKQEDVDGRDKPGHDVPSGGSPTPPALKASRKPIKLRRLAGFPYTLPVFSAATGWQQQAHGFDPTQTRIRH